MVTVSNLKTNDKRHWVDGESGDYISIHLCSNQRPKKIKELPRDLTKTLIYDRGNEMTQHKKFTMATNMQFYFGDPHSPWQRGTNEIPNGLVRGFFPKGTDFNIVTKGKLNWVQNALHERPRKTLEFNTPKETFNSLLLKY